MHAESDDGALQSRVSPAQQDVPSTGSGAQEQLCLEDRQQNEVVRHAGEDEVETCTHDEERVQVGPTQ
eukprot:12509776-Alexandrium_andersonii.AAC.1